MKLKTVLAVILLASLLSCLLLGCQNVGYLILSPQGLGSIKIGMSKTEVEKSIGGKLQPFKPDSTAVKQRAPEIDWGCNDCTQIYTCKYKNVTLLLTFFRYTLYKKSDYELSVITSYPPSRLTRTKSGITIGISEKEFVNNCLKNGYHFEKEDMFGNAGGYFFSDDPDKQSSKILVAEFADSVLTRLTAVNMIGD